MERKPNFFIIGAPKCGTSALAKYLGEHDKIFFSVPKEPDYFAQDIVPSPFKTEEQYLKLFKNVKPYHKAVGDGSVLVIYSKTGVKDILKLNPKARFIVMIRNPLEAAQSMHGQRMRDYNISRREIYDSFKEAWGCLSAREKGYNLPKGCDRPLLFAYHKLYSYYPLLKSLFETVPSDRVHIVLYDDFSKNPRATYQGVLKFLDVEDDGREIFETVNKRAYQPLNWATRLAAVLSALKKRFFPYYNFGIVTKITSYTKKPFPCEVLTPDFIQEVLDYFHDDVTKLSKLINRDLSSWLKYEKG